MCRHKAWVSVVLHVSRAPASGTTPEARRATTESQLGISRQAVDARGAPLAVWQPQPRREEDQQPQWSSGGRVAPHDARLNKVARSSRCAATPLHRYTATPSQERLPTRRPLKEVPAAWVGRRAEWCILRILITWRETVTLIILKYLFSLDVIRSFWQ